jgi:putative transposase
VKLVDERTDKLTIAEACEAVGLARATYYRAKSVNGKLPSARRSHRRLSEAESEHVLDVLISDGYCDKSVRQVWAELIDAGIYYCSVRTMYRILAENAAVRERRNQLRHPEYTRPELLATGPNQLWSWDITKLKGPHKWTYYYLYVLLDVWSRKVVGWMVAERESSTLAVELIRQSCEREGISENQLTVHADRGSSMRSKPVAFLLADLGVTKTHSRPYTSTDNPYSEAQFKTLKYQPEFPDRFGSLEDARAFLRCYFSWYNTDHRHSGIGLVSPAKRHDGTDKIVYEKRQAVLAIFYEQHSERFVRGLPSPPELPGDVWINPPRHGEIRSTHRSRQEEIVQSAVTMEVVFDRPTTNAVIVAQESV